MDRKPGAAPTEQSLYGGLAAFRHTLRRFMAFSDAATDAAGVTPQQYQALLVIGAHPQGRIMVRELAEQMLLKPHGAVQLVDRLAHGALVERQESPTDRRSVLVALTGKGAAVLEQLAANHRRELLRYEPLLRESLRRLRSIGR